MTHKSKARYSDQVCNGHAANKNRNSRCPFTVISQFRTDYGTGTEKCPMGQTGNKSC